MPFSTVGNLYSIEFGSLSGEFVSCFKLKCGDLDTEKALANICTLIIYELV
jgi:hypothetical protein